jgi:hypothetical protein
MQQKWIAPEASSEKTKLRSVKASRALQVPVHTFFQEPGSLQFMFTITVSQNFNFLLTH